MELSVKSDTRRNKGGRPTNASKTAYLRDEGQAYEKIKEKWTLLADLSADEALKAARSEKTDGKALVGKYTAAAIAYDKRWSKSAHDNTEINVPGSIATALGRKLANHTQANQQVVTEVAHLSQVCDLCRQAMEELSGL